MPRLPDGTVTFLFTDVEGSTRLLHDLGAEGYAAALLEHRRVLRDVFDRNGGVEVDTQGDAFFVAFQTAPGALKSAAELTAELSTGPIRVRVGVHTGTPLVTEQGYVGADVHRAARIAASGAGGQVLVSSSSAALAESTELRDLGEHRFKDLAAPERVFQLGAGDFTPIRSLYRTNLPVPATAFLGRELELTAAVGLLGRPDVRLLTLSGPGGTGKTRLALQAAAESSDDYPDGVWWVPLASLRDPALVLQSVADAIGLKDEPNGSPASTLAAGLEGKRMLVLLDNAEHLLPRIAADVASLVDTCPSLEVLVTSRETLQIQAEHEFAVPSFAPHEAVSFFLERTSARGVHLNDSAALRELCARLDELPLALELAAARSKLFPPEQLLDRLGQRLDLLKGGRDADPRQRTLRATIEWSHELLDDEEQRVFRALSVFVGGCTYDAAAEICQADADTLQSLLEKSLLRRRDGVDERYWMLETIREYAAERLGDAGLGADVHRAHSTWYVNLGRSLERVSGVTDREGMERLRSEQSNLRAALEYSFANDDLESVARLIAASWSAWLLSGLGREGAAWARRALVGCDDLPPALCLKLMGAASELMRFSGARAEALELKLELAARDLSEGDDAASHVLCELADMAHEDGDLVTANAYIEEALAFGRTPRALASLGDILLAEGRLDDAELAFAEARDGFLGEHDFNHAWTLLALAEVARRRGDRPRAMALCAEGLQRLLELGDQAGVGDALDGLAALVVDEDELAAARLTGAARSLRDEWGRPPGGLQSPLVGLPEREVEIGSGMSVEEAIELARAHGAPLTGSPPGRPRAGS